MSATSFTDWSIECDHPGCGRQEWVSEVDVRDLNVRGLRKILRARDWTVNVHVMDSVRQERPLDFCPDHKPAEG